MTRSGIVAILAPVLLAGASSASAEVSPEQEATPPAAQAAAPSEPPSASDDVLEYYIAPGDVLKLTVWKEPELTTDVFVRLDGRITVPLVGDLKVSGRTTEQVATEIRTKLRAFLEVPLVTLTVAQAISARFYVIGEVGTSGAFPLTGRITVVQALALAGGFRTFAKRERIVIIRERLGVRSAIPFNFRDLEVGARLEQNIPLLSGDIIIVP
jgi:polysaccharide biosynthesis/export protein